MVLRKKHKLLLFGSILFFVSIWYMFIQLDSSTDSATIKSNEDLEHLHLKLKVVEKMLQSNKAAMIKVRESMDSLLKMGNVHDPIKRQQLESLVDLSDKILSMKSIAQSPVNDTLKHQDYVDTCPALMHDVSHSDVSMIDVYNKLAFDDPDGGVWKQGYPIVTTDLEWVDKKLKVFVVPHSHNDPGWIKTLDRYFQDQTQHILNTIVDALSQDSSRKFIWAEMSYLSMWWNIATPERKLKMKELIVKGQIEIVTGGWVMTDEANSHYFAMIDQMIEGNEWLSRTIGVVPHSGYSIDPFGMSSTMAYLLKKMKFDNMLIQRVHYAIKKHLSLETSLEFRWRQGWASDKSTDILCHMMPFYSYDIPHTCGPDPKICCQFDFARLPGGKYNCPWKVPPVAINDGNVAERSAMLLDQYRKKSKLYKTNTLLVILGDDFRYTQMKEALDQFGNYRKIFDYVNSHPEMHAELKFGTLTEYFDAMKEEIGGEKKFPSLTGDFFTYADREDHYWSGYYVSRPFHKMQERVLETHLRGAEILFSLALPTAKRAGVMQKFAENFYPLLINARQNLGLFQHHDGITGTAKDHVVIDYGNRLMKSVMDAKKVISMSAEILLRRQFNDFDPTSSLFDYDEIYNSQNQSPDKKVVSVSQDGADVKVGIYNSLAYKRSGVVSILVTSPDVIVRGGDGARINHQTNLLWSGDVTSPSDKFELQFLATVPASGIAIFHLSYGKSEKRSVSRVSIYNSPSLESSDTRGPFVVLPKSEGEIKLENNLISAQFSSSTGFLQSITNKRSGETTKVAIDFTTYTSRNAKDKSGAYLFLPSGQSEPHVPESHRPVIRVIQGDIASHVHVILPNLVHRVSLYNGNNRGSQPLGVHVCNDVDVRSNYDNKEIAMRLKTDVQSEDHFYTDLNGFQIQKRTYYKKLPLQANFYPMPSLAFIQDKTTRVSLLTGQPLGVSSVSEGQLEVIMDRRLMQDDNRGLGQGVKDNVMTPESFVILVEKWEKNEDKSSFSLSYPSLVAHQLTWELLHPFRVMPVHKEGQAVSLRFEFEPLIGTQWPCDVHLLNLRAVQSRDAALPTDRSALILHRVGFECDLDSKKRVLPYCVVTDATKNFDIPLTSLFPASDVYSTSLSLQHDVESSKAKSSVSVKPMEIEAYKVKLT